MRRPRRDLWAPRPEWQTIACFGGAELVKNWAGKLEIRGGTPEQAQAREWQRCFEPPAAPLVPHPHPLIED